MRHAVVLTTLLFSTALILEASPFANGSFEAHGAGCEPLPTSSGFNTFAAGNTCITDWSILNGNIDYISFLWPAAEGTHSLDMNGDSGPSAVQQTFDTIAGLQYLVSFSLAGNTGAPPSLKSLDVDAAGQSRNYTFDSTGFNNTVMGWAAQTFTFTANSTSTALTFTSTTGGCCAGPALDNVSVAAVGTVPEPPSTGLLVAGVALLILGRRPLRRRLL
jgi:choice-of-anchor C domain-containing protein